MAEEVAERVNARDSRRALVREFCHLDATLDARLARQVLEGDLAGLWQHVHESQEADKPTALCLSGGGIRSATFGLGVLQGLATAGRLQSFRYLSTVSGGGYIGGWLASWLARSGLSQVMQELDTGPAPRGRPDVNEPDAAPVAHLRGHSNYLSPIRGLSVDSLSLAAIFVRNLLLNWLVWIPLLCGLVALPRVYVALLSFEAESAGAGVAASAMSVAVGVATAVAAVLAAFLVVVGIAYIVADLPAERPTPASRGVKSRFAQYCFAPVFLAAVAFSVLAVRANPQLTSVHAGYFAGLGAAAHMIGALAGVYWRVARRNRRRRVLRSPGRDGVAVAVVAASGGLGGLLLWAVLWLSGSLSVGGIADHPLYATLAVPAMLCCFWLTMVIYAGVLRRWTDEGDREWWSRASAWWLAAALMWVAVFVLVIYVPPWLLDRIGASVPAGAQLGVGGAVLGVVTSAIGFWSKNGASIKRRAATFLEATGLRLLDLLAAAGIVVVLLAVCLLVSEIMSTPRVFAWPPLDAQAGVAKKVQFLREEARLYPLADAPGSAPERDAARSSAARAYALVLKKSNALAAALFAGLVLAIAVGVSWCIGANVFSLHGMYGNRLVRAYLGATRARRHPHWFTGFDPGDDLPMHSLGMASVPRQQRRLYLVVNIALNLVQPTQRRLARQQRKAASFTATALHCGSAGIGFVPPRQYGDVKGMGLGRALTISGAAASPNMGYHSSRLVSVMMTWFNVRLGWWSPNPAPRWRTSSRRSETGLGLRAMLDEAFGRTTDDRKSVYLSDGGHFENLGLYEMVRRRCHRIVLVDATCDPEFKYADLHNAVRKIRIDFGIPIELPDVLPAPDRGQAPLLRYFVARIRYSQRDGCPPEADGHLYYIKPMLTGGEPADITDYAAESAQKGSVFPHQSTSDQFFDETQFESYRLLGLQSALETLPRQGGWPEAAKIWVDDKKTKAAGEPPPAAAESSGASAFGGLGLATALALGGTIGVVGTLGLKPGSEIALSEQDRALLRGGIVLKIAEPAQPDAARLAGLWQSYVDLSSRTQNTLVNVDASVVQRIETLAIDVRALQARLMPPAERPAERVKVEVTLDAREALARLRDELCGIRRALERQPDLGPRPSAEKLDAGRLRAAAARATPGEACP